MVYLVATPLLRVQGDSSNSVPLAMLEKPLSLSEEFWDAECCGLSFALPKEPGAAPVPRLPLALVGHW